jgi:hypothetical protein
MLGKRRAAMTGTPCTTTLPQGTWGAMDGHDRQHHHAWVGQHLGGLVGLDRHRTQGGGEGAAAVPELPGRVKLEATAILLGVDHEHPTRADHQVVKVGVAAGTARSCRTAYPCRSRGSSSRAVRRGRGGPQGARPGNRPPRTGRHDARPTRPLR